MNELKPIDKIELLLIPWSHSPLTEDDLPIGTLVFAGRANWGLYILNVGWTEHRVRYTSPRYEIVEHKGMLTTFRLNFQLGESSYVTHFQRLFRIGSLQPGVITPDDNLGSILLNNIVLKHALPGGPEHKARLLDRLIKQYDRILPFGRMPQFVYFALC
jgi:hypothetical protein